MTKPSFFFSILLLAGNLIAQENVIVIEGGPDKGGLLEATINGDTTKTKHVYCCGPTAVKPVAAHDNLFVYPNPFKSVLNVKNAKNADITIMNMDGRVVRTAKNVSSVNVSDLANGMYSVTIKEGKKISIQKVHIASN